MNALSSGITSYAELLRLTLPQIVIALTALVALTVDLSVLRRSALETRWKVGASIAGAGCAGSIFMLLGHSPQGSLADGMLVVNSLTQLIQAALVFLQF